MGKLVYLIRNIQLFAEGDETPPEGNEAESVEKYLEAIKKLKETTVPIEEMEKLKKENQSLLKAVLDGVIPEGVQGNDNKPEGDENPVEEMKSLISDLYGTDGGRLDNLSYVEKMLKLRTLEMDAGYGDPMLGLNPGRASMEDQEIAQKAIPRVVEVLEQCIERADGNSDLFDALLQQRLVDDQNAVLRANKARALRMAQEARKGKI